MHTPFLWVVRVGGDDGKLRPWRYICVYSIESRLIMRVESNGNPNFCPRRLLDAAPLSRKYGTHATVKALDFR